ncbi:sigma-54-dependent Fis family transcriptional regulator [candidate division WOR-3 bacterium]|nr:sigma-54-dependent Fis family transcriptional regulator [candidate division WOR-3 bacterium]
MFNILLIDDEADVKDVLEKILHSVDCTIKQEKDTRKALSRIKEGKWDLILLDLLFKENAHPVKTQRYGEKLSQYYGLEILEESKKKYPELGIMVLTVHEVKECLRKALQIGAYDYLVKEFDSEFRCEHIYQKIKHYLEVIHLKKENGRLRSELRKFEATQEIIGRSKKLQKVLELARKVADTDCTILIQGETGTGKELIARAIHQMSLRRDNPFITVDCGALPETLLESELFGHEKGAFTGAIQKKEGRLNAAHKGTIFLDEIGAASPKVQADLLRAIEKKEITPIGSTKPLKIDARIIVATNVNLEDKVKSGKFRKDLFYRLSVVPIHIPPLRERTEDMSLLLEYFLRKYCAKYKFPLKRFSHQAMESLTKYNWPGNIRELENLVESMVTTCEGKVIGHEALPDKFKATPDTNNLSLRTRVRSFEKEIITSVLEQNNWNCAKVSNILKMPPRTLGYRIKKYNLAKNRR